MVGRKGDRFTCTLCGEICVRDRDDNEAMEDAINIFGERAILEASLVCDICFVKQQILHPVDQWKKEHDN